jgi:CPA1 family monovalent cation:H+ antiporter
MRHADEIDDDVFHPLEEEPDRADLADRLPGSDEIIGSWRP